MRLGLSFSDSLKNPTCILAYDNLLPSNAHKIALQRSRRWASNVDSVEIIVTIMARAPDVTEVGPVLNDASEMGANCSKGPQISIWSSNQDSRLAPELEDLSAVGFYVVGFD